MSMVTNCALNFCLAFVFIAGTAHFFGKAEDSGEALRMAFLVGLLMCLYDFAKAIDRLEKRRA